MLKQLFNFIWLRKKWVVLSLVILALGYFVGVKFIFAPKTPPYKTVPVVKKDLSSIVSASGKTESEEKAMVKFQTAGYLSWVGVKQWDKVEKWQALACLDKEELQKSLQQELLDYMNERWDQEEITLDTYRDMAVTETIRRAKEQSQFDLDRVVLDVEIANIALKYACISSPIGGIVTETTIPYPGINISLLTDQIVIANPEKIYFSANVDETDIGQVKKGMPTRLILDAYPEEELMLAVKEVEFTSTVTSGGGTAFSVNFDLPPNVEEKYKLGMNGDVEIITEKKDNILVIPFEAIQTNDELGEYVWLVKDEQPQKQAIKTGISDDINTQVLQGLEKNDQVVISGFKTLEKNHQS